MNPWKLSTFVFASLFAATVGTQAIRSAGADRQPHMQTALSQLQSARDSLQNAASDKGGYRVKALGLTKQAIAAVEKGIAFDNHH